VKLFLLVLPCSSEITFKMRIGLQLGVSMRRQHFAMGVNVDTLVLGLLQQQMKVIKIMATDYDKRPFFNCERNSGGNRCSIGLGVCLVKQLHALEVGFSGFHDNGKQLIHSDVLADGFHSLVKKAVDLWVGITEHQCVIRISSHSTKSEKN